MRTSLSAAAGVLLIASFPALAQPANDGWTVRAGAGALLAPSFQGSRTYQLSALPGLRVAYGQRFFLSVEEGAGYALVDSGNWSAGPLLRLAFKRDEDGSSPFRIAGRREGALRGLGDVPTTAEAGGFAKVRWGNWSAQGELRHGIGGHDAAVGTLALSHAWRFSSPFTHAAGPAIVTLGPRLGFASAAYARAYFGVDPVQSARSGLRTYDTGGGVMSYGLGGVVVAPVAPRTALTLVFGYDRLGAPASRSPLVRERGSRNQAVVGLFASYEFSLR